MRPNTLLMSNEISFDGVKYISAGDAAERSGFTCDYIGRLCRDGKVRGRRIGKNWYVENKSFGEFLVTQEYTKSLRNESLARERAQEYKAGGVAPAVKSTVPVALAALIAPVVEKKASARIESSASTLKQRSEEIRGKLLEALNTKTPEAVKSAANLAYAPGGFTSAAFQTLHVPVYTLTPLMEFAHKLIALTLTLALVLGTYAAVDPQYARFAIGSMREEAASAIASYHIATGNIGTLADTAQKQVALAAENPQVAAAGIAGLFTGSVPDIAANIARGFNTGVNNLVYSIAFPQNLLRSSGIAANSSGSVSVSVQPYANPAKSGIRAEPSTVRPKITSPVASGSTVINNYTIVQPAA